MATKKIGDFDVFDHGLEHSQYFQGHGTAFTRWEECATGCGDNFADALDDCLESMAQAGWETDGLEERIKEKNPIFLDENGDFKSDISASQEESDCDHESSELWYYVSMSWVED